MPDTLICLTSSQRMQNVIPLFQKGLNFQRVVLLVSSHRSDVKKFDPFFLDITKTMQSSGIKPDVEWQIYPHPINPMDIDSIRGRVAGLVEQYGGARHVTVNYTGGTKPMAIGAYLGGLDAGADRLYVDTQAEQIFLNAKVLEFDLEPILITQILRIHGKPIDEGHIVGKALKPYQWQIAKAIYQNRQTAIDECIKIREYYLKLRKSADEYDQSVEDQREKRVVLFPSVFLSDYSWFFGPIIEAGMAQKQPDGYLLDGGAINFLDGGWLEAYAFLALENCGYFVDVKSNLCLENVPNELDVVCSLHGKLGILECKAGNLKSKTGQSALTRLANVSGTSAGIFAQSFLVLKDEVIEQSKVFKDRAASNHLFLIGRKDLIRIEDIVLDVMSRKH